MSALSELMVAIKQKIIDTDLTLQGISWFEETDPYDSKRKRPKIVIDVPKFRSAGYIDQRSMEWNFYYGITGYLKKDMPDGKMFTDWTEEDRIAINDWAFSTVNKVYSLHDDKQAGTLNITGFKQFAGESECWVDLEIIPGQAVFKLNVVAIVHLSDTEDGGS